MATTLFGGFHVACPQFDIDELDVGYTYCSTPSFNLPTAPENKFPVLSIPALPFPGHCPRVPSFDKQVEVSPTIGATKFMMYLGRYEKTLDGCDPAPAFTAQLTLPCLPLTVNYSRRNVSLKNEWTAAAISYHLSRKTGCEFKADLNLKLPCTPVALTYKKRTVAFARARTNPSLRFQVTRQTKCRMQFDMSLELPCLPFTMNVNTPVINRISRASIAAPNTFKFSAFFNRNASACGLDFSHNIEVPVPCIKAATGIPRGVGANAGWNFVNAATHSPQRCLDFSYKLSVPVVDALIDAHLGIIVGGGVPAVQWINKMNLFAGGRVDPETFYLRISGPEAFGACPGPMLYDVEMKATHDAAWPTPTFVRTILENGACTKRIGYSLQLPKYLLPGDLATGSIIVNGAYISGNGLVWEAAGVLRASLNLTLACDPCAASAPGSGSGASGAAFGAEFAVPPLGSGYLPLQLAPAADVAGRFLPTPPEHRASVPAAKSRRGGLPSMAQMQDQPRRTLKGANTAFVRFDLVFVREGVTLQARYRELYKDGALMERVSMDPISFPRRL